MKRNDWILAGVFLAAAFFIFLGILFSDTSERKYVTVFVDGEKYGTYSLEEDVSVDIGESNSMIIRDGKVWMSRADCPDQICVKHRPISRNGGSIICLPNKVAIIVERDGGQETDGIAR